MFIDIFTDLLEENCLNKRQFAQRSGIPYPTVIGWTNLSRLPDYMALIKIADFFHCSVDYLMGRESDLGKPRYQAGNSAEGEKQLLKWFRELNGEERDIVLQISKLLATHDRR